MAGEERARLMKDQGKVSQCVRLLSSAMWAKTVVRLCRASHEQLGI